jgi:hypothetical protein
MVAMKVPGHGAGLEVERGEQVGGALMHLVGSIPLSLAEAHRQSG